MSTIILLVYLFQAQIFLLCLRITYCLLDITNWISYRNFQIRIPKKKKNGLTVFSLKPASPATCPRLMNSHHQKHRCLCQKSGAVLYSHHTMRQGSSHIEPSLFIHPAMLFSLWAFTHVIPSA